MFLVSCTRHIFVTLLNLYLNDTEFYLCNLHLKQQVAVEIEESNLIKTKLNTENTQ